MNIKKSTWLENQMNKIASTSSQSINPNHNLLDALNKIAGLNEIGEETSLSKEELVKTEKQKILEKKAADEATAEETKKKEEEAATAEETKKKEEEAADASKKEATEEATPEEAKKKEEEAAAAEEAKKKEEEAAAATKKEAAETPVDSEWMVYAPDYVKESSGFIRDYYTKIGNIIHESLKANDEELEKQASTNPIMKLAVNTRAILTGLGIGGAGIGGATAGASIMKNESNKVMEDVFGSGFELGQKAMLEQLMQLNGSEEGGQA